jgi:hypothetical protein
VRFAVEPFNDWIQISEPHYERLICFHIYFQRPETEGTMVALTEKTKGEGKFRLGVFPSHGQGRA